MTTEQFKASVQYGDWSGSSAADDADQADANEWLRARGHIEPEEFLAGVRAFVGENHGEHRDPIRVQFLLASSAGYDDIKAKIDANEGPLEVRAVSEDMELADFFGLFKRVDITFSRNGVLDNLEYSLKNE